MSTTYRVPQETHLRRFSSKVAWRLCNVNVSRTCLEARHRDLDQREEKHATQAPPLVIDGRVVRTVP